MPSGKPIDWALYDQTIKDKLPSLTIEQFTLQFLGHISTKAVGARARKLGIKPAQYRPDDAHRQKIAAAIRIETPALLEKIRDLRDSTSLRELAKACSIGVPTLARLMKNHAINLTDVGIKRARESSRLGSVGKIPWNKGKKLPDDMKIKMAIGRQRMSGRLSQLQASFYKILDENCIGYCREEDDRCRFGYWTFDCRIIHAGFDFLVEVQGGYIHSLPKNVIKDQAKATYMERYFPDIKVKYVWEHEFGAANRVKQKLREWLGITKISQTDFEFKDVSVKMVVDHDAGEFLAAFHYLGKLAGRIKLGAYHNVRLIAVSVWGAPTRSETATRLGVTPQQCLELRRFVIHDAYHKNNFASWLLARMEKRLPDTIPVLVSFADAGIGHTGTIYKAGGWTSDGQTEPSNFYVDDDGYVMLKKTLFNLANKMHMKEADYADTYGYKKVPTPPKFRFVKRRPTTIKAI